MGMRTAIKLHHDYAFEIERRPEDFLFYIKMLLSVGSEVREVREGLESFGVHVTPTHHTSTDCAIHIGDNVH